VDVVNLLRELHDPATTVGRGEREALVLALVSEVVEYEFHSSGLGGKCGGVDDVGVAVECLRALGGIGYVPVHPGVLAALLAVAEAAERVRRCEHYWMIDGNCLRVGLSAEERCGACRIRTALAGLRDAAGAATERPV
jgi:hypothetical protein